jgi:tetratricopeptide (TPR) repeat protein
VTIGAEAEAAAWVQGLPEEVREAALVALYDWWGNAPQADLKSRLWEILERADDDPWRRRLREVIRTKGHGLLQELTREARARPLPAASYELLARFLVQEGRKEEAADLLRGARLLHPRDFWIPYALGNLLHDPSGPPPGAAELEEAAGCYRTALAIRPESHAALNNLGMVLHAQGKLAAAVAAFRQAIALDPKFAYAYNNLGITLRQQKKLAEAVAAFRRAIELKPDLSEGYNNLGVALRDQQKLAEAVTAFRKAIELKKDSAMAYTNLGNALRQQGKLDEAVAACRRAIELQPDLAEAYFNLGSALAKQKKLGEAVTAFRRSIELKPDLSEGYNNLGSTLYDLKKLDEAVAAFRRANALQPDDAKAYYNLGNALADQRKLAEAVAAYQQAIRLKPDLTQAHYNLGNTLYRQGKLAEAVAAYQEAIRLKPDYAEAHCNLGNALRDQGKLAEAIAAYQEAIRLKPDYAEAHCNLGHVLRQQGHLKAAQEALRRGHELGSPRPGWRYPSARWVQEIDRLVALEEKVPAILKGKARADGAAELLELAWVCHLTHRHATSSRFYADAMRAEPRRADDLRFTIRYNAACSAALAGGGRGTDFPRDDQARAALRRQALTWLRADLEVLGREAADGNPRDRADAAAALRHWQGDADLAGVRHPWSLLRLPADERRHWQKLWADVDELLKKASKTGE